MYYKYSIIHFSQNFSILFIIFFIILFRLFYWCKSGLWNEEVKGKFHPKMTECSFITNYPFNLGIVTFLLTFDVCGIIHISYYCMLILVPKVWLQDVFLNAFCGQWNPVFILVLRVFQNRSSDNFLLDPFL